MHSFGLATLAGVHEVHLGCLWIEGGGDSRSTFSFPSVCALRRWPSAVAAEFANRTGSERLRGTPRPPFLQEMWQARRQLALGMSLQVYQQVGCTSAACASTYVRHGIK